MKSAHASPRQPFVGIAVCAMVGVGVADFAHVRSTALLLAIVGATAVAALAAKRSLPTYVFVIAAFFALHTIRINSSTASQLDRLLGSAPAAVTLHGDVVSEPKISTRGVASFVLALRDARIGDVAHHSAARVLARWKHPVQFGDELKLFGTAELIPPPRNPGEFDMRAYLARQDITRQFTVTYPENGSVIRHTRGNAVLDAAQRSRAALQRILSCGLDDSPDVQSLITGMALGIRHQTPADIEEPFQQTGTLHLFAVAGLHVGIVAQLLWVIATLLRLSRKWATALIIPSLLFYAAVTGLHTSSVRAALMSAVLLSGFFVERRVFALNSLAAAAVLILCWNTNELFAVGFQLSFAVVAAIVLLAGPTFRFLRRRFRFDPFLPTALFSRTQRLIDHAWRWIARGLSVSFAAWIGSLPLMFWYYSLITPISLLANLAVVPIAFFVLAGALVSVVAAPFSTWLTIVFNNANWVLARLILALVHVFASLPSGHIYVERPHWPNGARLEINVLDVGTGAAIHLRTGDRDWLVDAGKRRDFNRTVRPYLRFRGVNRLDALVLTHADAGHIGGASDVLDVFSPRRIIDTAARARSPAFRELSVRLASGTRARAPAVAGSEYTLARGVIARVLFPPANFEASSADDQAIVMQLLVDGRSCVLLMSDSGAATERALLASGLDLRSDLIIKGQHRTGISGLPEFIDAVQPQAIIATSRDFPDAERIKEQWAGMLTERNIKLFRQDETGAVRLLIRRNAFEVQPYLTSGVFRSNNR